MKQPPPMTPLDEFTSSPELRMLKLFLPFLPSDSRHTLAVFVKFLEFRQALTLPLPEEPQLASQNLSDADGLFPETVLQSLKPYLTSQEQQIFETFETVQNMLSMMELFRAADMGGSMPFPFQSDFESSESVSPSTKTASDEFHSGEHTTTEAESAFSAESSSYRTPLQTAFDSSDPSSAVNRNISQSNEFSPTDLLMNMLSPEQRNSFQLYNQLFSSALTNGTSNSVDTNSSSQSSDRADPAQNISGSNKTEPQNFTDIQKGDLTYGKLDESSRNETDRSCQTGADQTGSPTDAGKEWT